MRLSKYVAAFLGIVFLFGVSTAFAQQATLAEQVYAGLSKREYVKLTVTSIAYRYQAVNGVPYFSKEPKAATVKAEFFYRGVPQRTILGSISLEPGQRLVDGLMFNDGHAESQEAGYLFYKSDKGLGSKFASIDSSTAVLNAAGRATQIALSGTWKDNPAVKATLTRENLKYDGAGKLISYLSRYTILNGVSGFPGGQVDAVKVFRIIYGGNSKPKFVAYGHFYGPGTTTIMENINYNQENEVVGCSLYMY